MPDKRDVWRYLHPSGLKAVVSRLGRRDSFRLVVVKPTGLKFDSWPFREDQLLPWLEERYGPGWQEPEPPAVEASDSLGQHLAIGDVVAYTTVGEVPQRGQVIGIGITEGHENLPSRYRAYVVLSPGRVYLFACEVTKVMPRNPP